MAYLYRHIRLDKNEPFYIGISVKEDIKHKRAYAKNYRHRNNLWDKIVSKTDYRVEILFDNETPEFVKEKEIEFIKLYGRINLNTGILANLTDGGETNSGYKPTAETRLKLSINAKNRKYSIETRMKMSASIKGTCLGYKHTPETCKNMSIAQKKLGLTKENIRLIENSKKSVLVYDLNMNFIKEFSSIADCSIFYNIKRTKITNVLYKKIESYNNYIFIFK